MLVILVVSSGVRCLVSLSLSLLVTTVFSASCFIMLPSVAGLAQVLSLIFLFWKITPHLVPDQGIIFQLFKHAAASISFQDLFGKSGGIFARTISPLDAWQAVR